MSSLPPDDDEDSERSRYAAGLPDYHDPLAGFAGAPPAQSALTLRLVLASLGVLFSFGGLAVLAAAGAPIALLAFFGLAGLVAVVDIAVIVHRKRRGEPG